MNKENFYKLIDAENYLGAVRLLEANPEIWKEMGISELGNYFDKFRKYIAPKELNGLANKIGETIFGVNEIGHRNFIIYF